MLTAEPASGVNLVSEPLALDAVADEPAVAWICTIAPLADD